MIKFPKLQKTLKDTALEKAFSDVFSFALRLRTGELVEFESAEPLNDEWVRLTLTEHLTGPPGARIGKNMPVFPVEAPRGLDVRVSDIVWVADAPHGS